METAVATAVAAVATAIRELSAAVAKPDCSAVSKLQTNKYTYYTLAYSVCNDYKRRLTSMRIHSTKATHGDKYHYYKNKKMMSK